MHQYVREARLRGMGDPHAPRKTHKEYPRMPKIELPPHAPIAMPLGQALAKRSSQSASRVRLDVKAISTLLGNSLRIREDGKRPYPSAGALYPIETYLIANEIEGLPKAVLHYHPNAHALEYLWDIELDFSPQDIYRKSTGPTVGFIIFTSMWNRSARKYGDFSYYHGMLEAGHAAQNILLAAAALGISACPIGGFTDTAVSNLLDLDENNEQPVYVVKL